MSEKPESAVVRASTIIGIFATIVSVVVSLFQCQRENSRQKHEIRAKYLDLALSENGTAYEKGRILRFIKRIDDDKDLSKWATDELDTIQVNKRAEEGKLVVAQSLAALKDSMHIAISDSSKQLASLIQKYEKKQSRLFGELDSLQLIINRTAKEAAISGRPHGFKTTDIDFVDIPIGPNCNVKTVRSFEGNLKYDSDCLDSYGKQKFDSVSYIDKKWKWIAYKVEKWDKKWDKQWELQRVKIPCECNAE
jgi:hypothetical protein